MNLKTRKTFVVKIVGNREGVVKLKKRVFEMSEILHHEITEAIIKCAYEVHNHLGSGFLEKVYENALCKELEIQGVASQTQVIIRVDYKGSIVGDYLADILVENKVLVELKAVERVIDIHELQLKNYLKATGIEVGLLLNFGKCLEIKRKYVKAEKMV